LVDIASGGTLFIDEVCEMDAAAQVKLLNVLDTGIYRRVGETRERKANLRVIAATNRNIREEVAERNFREDLYYRLDVIHIRIPPLRDRKEDIPLLVDHFLEHANAPSGERKTSSREFVRVLTAHDWPGNVRELANVVERAVIVSSKEKRLTPKHLPAELVEKAKGAHRQSGDMKTLEQMEAEYIQAVLKRERGNKSRTAKILGITRATLRRKLACLGLQ
jgi:transcriptional regulator with PAS, ATPase and Fis domain